MPELRFTRRAREDLRALPETVRDAVLETASAAGRHPESIGKPLLGRLEGLWSARVGNYRIIYSVESNGVVIRAIRHRGVAYRRRQRP